MPATSLKKTRQETTALNPPNANGHPQYPRTGIVLWLRTFLLACWSLILWYVGNVAFSLFQIVTSDPHELTSLHVLLTALLPGALNQPTTPRWMYVSLGGAFLVLSAGCIWAVIDAEHEYVPKLRQLIRREITLVEAEGKPRGDDAQQVVHGPPSDDLGPEIALVNRTSLLDWLETRLCTRSPQIPVRNTGMAISLYGPPGLGKTALASAAIRKFRQGGCFPDGTAVVRCEGLTDPVDILQRVLSRFDPHRSRPETADLSRLSDGASDMLGGKQALIVLDNVEPEWPVESVIEPLRHAGASIIVTSRQVLSHTVVGLEDARMVGLLTEQEALDVFARSYGRGDSGSMSSREQAAATAIVRALGNHTLAVRLAGAYAADTKRDLTELVTEFQDPSLFLATVLEDVDADASISGVERAISTSYNALTQDGRRLFAALAAFGGADFGRKAALALAQGLRLPRPERALDLLIRRSLLDAHVSETMPEGSDRQRMVLHPLLRAYGQQFFERFSQSSREQAFSALASYYAGYLPTVPDSAFASDEDNVARSIEWAQSVSDIPVAVRLISTMQYYWRDHGVTTASLRYLRWIIDAASRTAPPPEGEEGSGTAPSSPASDVISIGGLFWVTINYAYALHVSGQEAEASHWNERALELAKQSLHRQNEGIALAALGQGAQFRGQTDLAERYYTDALAIARENADQRTIAATLTALGQVSVVKGDLTAAERYYEEALRIASALSDQQTMSTLNSYSGQIAFRRGQLEQADRYFHAALSIARELGDRQLITIELGSLGRLAQAQTRFADAQRHYQEALQVAQQTGDKQAIGAMSTCLGQIEQHGQRFQVAQRYFRTALAVMREISDRQGEGVDLGCLADLAMFEERYEEAEDFYRQALAIMREVKDRQSEGIILSSLGKLAHRRSLYTDADNFYHMAYDLNVEIGHRRGQYTELINFGRLSFSTGDFAAAEDWYHKARDLAVVTTFAHDLGSIEALLGQIALSRKAFDQAALSYEEALAADRVAHDLSGECTDLYQLFTAARELGRASDASTHLRACYALANKIRALRNMEDSGPLDEANHPADTPLAADEEDIIGSLQTLLATLHLVGIDVPIEIYRSLNHRGINRQRLRS